MHNVYPRNSNGGLDGRGGHFRHVVKKGNKTDLKCSIEHKLVKDAVMVDEGDELVFWMQYTDAENISIKCNRAAVRYK